MTSLTTIFLEFKLGQLPKSHPSAFKLLKHIVMLILPSFFLAQLTWSYLGAAVAMTYRGYGLKTENAHISNLKN